jgi:predicted lipase
METKYNKTHSGIFFRCSCGKEVQGGSEIYVPVHEGNNSLTYGRAICNDCYKREVSK